MDKLIEAWTLSRSPEEAMKGLQTSGVAAGIVANARDIEEDPQLKDRHFYQKLEHPEMGWIDTWAFAFQLSKTPARLERAAPCLGEHTEYVCTRILGMSDEEFIRLAAEGVFD